MQIHEPDPQLKRKQKKETLHLTICVSPNHTKNSEYRLSAIC